MRLSGFILIGRKEKAGNTSRLRSFHGAYCSNMAEGVTCACSAYKSLRGFCVTVKEITFGSELFL